MVVNGTEGDDVLEGDVEEFSDINGLGGDDYLFGGFGNDALVGGPGVDVLIGNGGNDDLTGGPALGPDYFVVGTEDGFDTIYDFTPGSEQFPVNTIVLLGHRRRLLRAWWTTWGKMPTGPC
jgi:Ca2+-binding RTX toxin-like protein